MDESYVLVLGTSCMDVKGRPSEPLQPGASTPGIIHTSVGGVARNIAENLARLGVPTVLLSTVGGDRSGQRILAQAAQAGIDVSHVLVAPEATTGTYMALLDQAGKPAFALDDMRITAALRPRYIYDHRRLFRDAALVVIDASLRPPALKTVFRLAKQYRTPVCADPTTASLAHRMRPHLRDLLLITPNLREAETLCQMSLPERNREATLAAAKRLVALGSQIAVITLAERGLCYATSEESGHVPAVRTEIVDLTGAGDALAAAVVFALLNDIPVSEAVRLGCSAASLTVACDRTIVPDLTIELLYDNLSV